MDGYAFHKEDSKQYQRDLIKNRILNTYNIPFLRFKTNGSQEEKRISEKSDELLLVI